MTTLNDFKALRDSVTPEVQSELYRLFTADPDESCKRMVELDAEKGMTSPGGVALGCDPCANDALVAHP